MYVCHLLRVPPDGCRLGAVLGKSGSVDSQCCYVLTGPGLLLIAASLSHLLDKTGILVGCLCATGNAELPASSLLRNIYDTVLRENMFGHQISWLGMTPQNAQQPLFGRAHVVKEARRGKSFCGPYR